MATKKRLSIDVVSKIRSEAGKASGMKRAEKAAYRKTKSMQVYEETSNQLREIASIQLIPVVKIVEKIVSEYYGKVKNNGKA